MKELFSLAEQEMMELYHPYVGTEHFFLAYLKRYGNKYITYDKYREYVISIIGRCYKQSEYALYTTKLREIEKECKNEIEAVVRILSDDDSIAYNILLSSGEDIEKIYLDVINTNS